MAVWASPVSRVRRSFSVPCSTGAYAKINICFSLFTETFMLFPRATMKGLPRAAFYSLSGDCVLCTCTVDLAEPLAASWQQLSDEKLIVVSTYVHT